MKYLIIPYERLCRLNPNYNSITIDSTPSDEPCLQVGDPDYTREQAIIEATAHIDQIQRCFGPTPANVKFVITSNEHDAGTYYDINIIYLEEDESAVEYAFNCELGAFTKVEDQIKHLWDEEAIKWLTENGYSRYIQPKIIQFIPKIKKTA